MAILRFACCFLLTLPVLSMAQDKAGPCRTDVEKYCAQSRSGGKQAVEDCLLDHQKDVSDTCYDALKQRLTRQHDVQACKQDMDKFCQGVQPGGGRIINCLRDHQKDISDGCYDMLSKKMKGGR